MRKTRNDLALIEHAAQMKSIKGVAIIAFIPGDSTKSWISKMKVVGILTKVIWRGRNQKPGFYNVTLKVGNKLITKSGVLMPPIPYSIANYKAKK